jgi:4-hydroxybenzoate polyprenyltransferase
MKRQLIDFFGLIRWKNVLIYILIQGLIFYFLQPINKKAFIFMSLAFLLLGMAMNIQNNIFDKEIDKQKENYINFNSSIYQYIYLFFLLVFLILLLSTQTDLNLILTALSSLILLWLYNSFFKKTPFYGNFLVALVTSIAVILPGWAGGFLSEYNYLILIFLGIYAFIVNLMRELLKDIQDVPIDRKGGYKTMAILNLEMTKNLYYLFAIILVVNIYFIHNYIIAQAFWSLWLWTIFIVFYTIKRIRRYQYKQASSLLKWLMVVGFILVLIGIKSSL